jgi:hypothetical protein
VKLLPSMLPGNCPMSGALDAAVPPLQQAGHSQGMSTTECKTPFK